MNDAKVASRSGTALGGAQGDAEQKLPRRDWILIPAVSLLTICILSVSSEAIGTWVVPRQGKPLEDCMIMNDLATGIRGVPNSTCWNRLLEGPRVENKFNSCGHRAGIECGPKPPDDYRIVMAGSSLVFGLGVARENTVAALLPVELSQQTGRKVDLYNEGLEGKFARHLDRHFDEILAAHPDMILWILSPLDIKNAAFMVPDPDTPAAPKKEAPEPPKSAGFVSKAVQLVKTEFSSKSVPDALADLADNTRTIFLLRHSLYQSQSIYVQRYLMDGDDAGFLRAEPSPEWQARMQHFDAYFKDIEAQAKAARVPLVVVLVPNRAQAAMISMNEWPAGYDPYALDRKVSEIVTGRGAYYLDILPDFRNIPNPEQDYYPIDGHPSADGNALISRLLARKFASGAVPELEAVTTQPQTLEQAK